MRLSHLPCAILLAAAAPSAFAGVLIVGGPQQTHGTVSSAIAAAVDGDVILVRVPSTTNITINGKSLTVIGDLQPAPKFDTISVSNLAAGKLVVLSGLVQKFGADTTYAPAVDLKNNAGSVRIQDCQIAPFSGNYDAISIQNCASVVLARTSVTGAPGMFSSSSASPATAAVSASGSTVALYDCPLNGGRGRDSGFLPGGYFPLFAGRGSAAVVGTDSDFAFSGCMITGGDGGTGHSGGVPPPQCVSANQFPTDGGDAGEGLVLNGPLSITRLRASPLQGGTGGAGGFDGCGNQVWNGWNGTPYAGLPSALVPVSGTARGMIGPGLVRESTSNVYSFLGQPGDGVYLLTSLSPSHQWAPSLHGTLMVGNPLRRTFLGTIPIGGQLDVPMPTPALPIGVAEAEKHLQCVMLDLAGASHAGTPTVQIVVDQQY